MPETSQLEIPNPSQMREEIQVFASRKDELVAWVMDVRVTTEQERAAATELLTSILVPLLKKIDDKRKKYSLTLRQLATQWDGEFKPTIQEIEGLISHVKQVLLEYQLEQERIQRERQAELDRQAEKERKRLEKQGKTAQIPEDIGILAPQPEKTVRTASGSSTVRRVPIVVVTDLNLIPRKYLMVNHAVLDPDVRGGVVVPGAELGYREELAVRAR